MARIVTFDPGTSEIRSPLIAGLTEACNKLSGVLDMQTNTFVDVELSEVKITDNDRYRIYQIQNGRRLWLQAPMPIIKKNGEQITESNDGFSIDYIGGSIIFETGYTLTSTDHITVSATYITDSSNKISNILTQIATITETAGHYKGYYATIEELNTALPTGTAGDYALVGEDSSFHIWDTETEAWINSQADIDVNQFYDKSQIDELLEGKENALITDELAGENKDEYYLTGNKTWKHFATQVLGTVLTDLETTTSEKITALDSVVGALGKLQAQLDNNIGGISGIGTPTETTSGIVGQDYINISNGDKYYLVAIEELEDGTKKYKWEQYAKKSDTPTNVITIDNGANMEMPESYGHGEWTFKIVEEAEPAIEIDEIPTENSDNAVSSGGVYNALKTKANKSIAFRAILLSSSWRDNQQTLSDTRFSASDNYGFYISPVGSDYREYTENNVFLYSMNNGNAVFECDSVPTKNLQIDVIRSEVETTTSNNDGENESGGGG